MPPPQLRDVFSPLPQIEVALERALALSQSSPVQTDALRYATLGAGKRLRPILAWHCCEAAGGTGEASLPAGVAVELVHCFSLVHDDLPALDNDDLRRGQPTLHKRSGEAMAILAGDALLNLAYEVLSDEGVWGDLAPATWSRGVGAELQVKLLRELSRATGAMVRGQVGDTLQDFPAEVSADPRSRLGYIHSAKTGALLSASCIMGLHCACGGGTHPEPAALRAITTFGERIGVLFQAVDDLLDVTQTSEHTGKRTNKDASAGKLASPPPHTPPGT